MKRENFRISTILFALIACIMMSATVSAMSRSKLKAAKPAVKFVEAGRTYNIKQMEKQFINKKKTDGLFFRKNAYMRRFCRSYNKQYLQCTIKKVTIKGNNATVKLRVTHPDAFMACSSALDDVFDNEVYLYYSNANIDKYIYRHIIEYVDSDWPVETETNTVTFKTKKIYGKWKIVKRTDAIADIINCEYQSADKETF